ncbi:hypothetical protein RF55_6567 [Lasius niger]|uniref:Uncharacterized protein n=1 Tax=Lasius niger TaxID=67767 RepID=A0A0J7KSP1_LASNI|nr:hypothetical protein RF55_6567 [Lasius niger]
MLCSCGVAIIAILYILFDVNYFVRIIATVMWGRLFEKKKKLFDKTTIYEQQFISLTDNFVRAVVLSRQTVTGLKVPLMDIIAEIEPETRRPEPTKELQLWLESMEESSKNLRKQE